MTENTIDELIKINQELVQSDKIDSITYHGILTRLEYLKSINEWKLNTAMTVMTTLRIDIVVSDYVQKGIVKMICNAANLHEVMSDEFNKKNIQLF